MAQARLDTSPCPVPRWLPDAHSQTIWAAFGAHSHRISFVRERVDTPDGDFIDFDWIGPGLIAHRRPDGTPLVVLPHIADGRTAAARWIEPADWRSLPQGQDTPALVLFHGLEGGSKSRYAQAIAHYFRARGWVVVVAHFRGCSGMPNRLARAYYSGDSEEVGFMLHAVRQRVPHARWYAAGVSLGGNALLKYLGEQGNAVNWLAAAAGISVPLDLVAGGDCLSRGLFNRQVYSAHFLRTMKHKVLEKAHAFPAAIDAVRISQARDLREFDDAYTAPMHGFKNALDYWKRASSKPLLGGIRIATLVLNACNDPFMPATALPNISNCGPLVLLHQPPEGGHAGFPTGPFPTNTDWLPQRLARFFEMAV